MPLTALEQTDAHLDHSPASARSRIARRPAYTLLPNAQHLLRDPRCLAVTTQPWTHANSASKVSAVFLKTMCATAQLRQHACMRAQDAGMAHSPSQRARGRWGTSTGTWTAWTMSLWTTRASTAARTTSTAATARRRAPPPPQPAACAAAARRPVLHALDAHRQQRAQRRQPGARAASARRAAARCSHAARRADHVPLRAALQGGAGGALARPLRRRALRRLQPGVHRERLAHRAAAAVPAGAAQGLGQPQDWVGLGLPRLRQHRDAHQLLCSSVAADNPLRTVGPGVSNAQSEQAHAPSACCGGSRARQWGSRVPSLATLHAYAYGTGHAGACRRRPIPCHAWHTRRPARPRAVRRSARAAES